MTYKVMVNMWDNSHYDYITGEYSGIIHKDKKSAEIELRETINENLESYISEDETCTELSEHISALISTEYQKNLKLLRMLKHK